MLHNLLDTPFSIERPTIDEDQGQGGGAEDDCAQHVGEDTKQGGSKVPERNNTTCLQTW